MPPQFSARISAEFQSLLHQQLNDIDYVAIGDGYNALFKACV